MGNLEDGCVEVECGEEEGSGTCLRCRRLPINLHDGRAINLHDGRAINLHDGRPINMEDGCVEVECGEEEGSGKCLRCRRRPINLELCKCCFRPYDYQNMCCYSHMCDPPSPYRCNPRVPRTC